MFTFPTETFSLTLKVPVAKRRIPVVFVNGVEDEDEEDDDEEEDDEDEEVREELDRTLTPSKESLKRASMTAISARDTASAGRNVPSGLPLMTPSEYISPTASS